MHHILTGEVSGGGRTLQCYDTGELHVVRFLSRATTPAERRYGHPSKLESRAVVWATERLRQYLLGRHFTLQTDARNLVWLSQRQLDRGPFARWIVQLSEYDFTVEHATVPAEDALSRHPAGELAVISVAGSAPSVSAFSPSRSAVVIVLEPGDLDPHTDARRVQGSAIDRSRVLAPPPRSRERLRR